VVEFACAKCRRISILHNLTDMRRKASASFGCVARVPVAYHRVDSVSHAFCIALVAHLASSLPRDVDSPATGTANRAGRRPTYLAVLYQLKE
jgi:hypothetical protein